MENQVVNIKKLEKLFNNYIIDFQVISTIRKVGNYFSNKNKTAHELKSNVVYEYECFCNKSIKYTGFTSKPLVEIVKERLKGKTAVSYYINSFNICKIEIKTVYNFGIFKEFRNKFETLISKALLTKRYYQNLNKQLN